VVWFIPELYNLLPPVGFWLLVAGGACYSVGCIFYVLKKVPYFHAIFHLFILAGSILQYFSILLFVL
jgi:hemolysin III